MCVIVPYLKNEMQGHINEIDEYEIEKIREVIQDIQVQEGFNTEIENCLMLSETTRRLAATIRRDKKYKKWLMKANVRPDLKSFNVYLIHELLDGKPVAFALNEVKIVMNGDPIVVLKDEGWQNRAAQICYLKVV